MRSEASHLIGPDATIVNNQANRVSIAANANASSSSLKFSQVVFILAAPGCPESHRGVLERVASVIVLAPTSGFVWEPFLRIPMRFGTTDKIAIVAESHEQLVNVCGHEPPPPARSNEWLRDAGRK